MDVTLRYHDVSPGAVSIELRSLFCFLFLWLFRKRCVPGHWPHAWIIWRVEGSLEGCIIGSYTCLYFSRVFVRWGYWSIWQVYIHILWLNMEKNLQVTFTPLCINLSISAVSHILFDDLILPGPLRWIIFYRWPLDFSINYPTIYCS